MADLGFKQVSMEPVVAQPEDDYAIREEDIPKICEEYDKLAKEMIKREKEGRGFQFLPFHDRSFRRSLRLQAAFRLWLRNRVSGSYPLGRFLSLPSVRRKREIPSGQRGRRESFIRRFRTNSSAATFMPRKNVRNALPDSTAAEAVLLIPITSMAPSTMPMTSAVSSSAREWSARL